MTAVVLWCVLALFLLIAGILIFITLPPGEHLVASIAESQIQQRLNLPVRIDAIETNLVSRISISGVVVPQPDDSTMEYLATVGRVKATYSLLPLLKKTIVVNTVEVDNLTAFLRRDAAGNLVIPNFGATEIDSATTDTTTENAESPTDSASSGFVFKLGRATINHAFLHYKDDAIPLESSVHDLNITATMPEPDSYAVELTVDSSFTDFDGNRAFVNDWLLRAVYAGTGTDVDTLHLTLPGLSLDLSNTKLDWDSVFTMDGNAWLEGDVNPLTKAYASFIPSEFRPIRGNIALQGRVSGPVDALQAEATLDVSNLSVPHWRLPKGYLDVTYTPDKVTLHKLNLSALGGTAEASGWLTLQEPMNHELELRLASIQLTRLMQSLEQDSLPVSGSVGALLHSRGELVFPEGISATLDLRVDNPTYDTLSVEYIMARASFLMGRADLQITQLPTTISAELDLTQSGMSGDFSLAIPDIQPYVAMFDTMNASGKVELAGSIEGPYEQPDIDAALSVSNVRYWDFPLDSLTARFLYQKGKPSLQGGHLRGTLTSIDTSKALFGVKGLVGNLTYDGTASWSPDSMDAQLKVDLVSVGYDTFLIDDATVLVKADENAVRLSELELNWNRLKVKGDGRYDLRTGSGRGRINFINNDNPDQRMGRIVGMYDQIDSVMNITVQGIGFDLEQVNTFLPEPKDIEGALTFNLGLEGTVHNPVADIVFRLQHPRIGQVYSDTIVAVAHMDTSAFELSRWQVFQEGQITNHSSGKVLFTRDSKGGLTPNREAPVDFNASGFGLDLRMVNPFLPEQQSLTGLGNYNFILSGTMETPHVSGELRIADAVYQTDPLSPPITGINMAMMLEDSVVTLKALTAHIMDTDFKLKSVVIVHDLQHIDARMHVAINEKDAIVGIGTLSKDSLDFGFSITDFSLISLQALSQDIANLDGSLTTTMLISGTTTQPRVEGQLSVKNLSLQPMFFEDPLKNGVIKMKYDQDKVTLETLEIEQNKKGRIFGSGTVSFDETGITDLNFTGGLRNIELAGEKMFEADIETADISYSKMGNTYNLIGSLGIEEARYTQTLSIAALLAMLDSPEVVHTTGEPNPILRDTNVNLQIFKSDNIWVDNNLASLNLEMEAAVTGRAIEPSITGNVVVEQGTINYLARKFNIISGGVTFVMQDSVSGALNLIAETTVKSYKSMEASTYEIELAINGEILSPTVTLTSDPSLDEADIVTLVTVGMTRAQLTGSSSDGSGSGTSSGGVLERRAEEITSQAISGYVDRKVGNAIGLDGLEIEGNLFRMDTEDAESMPTIAASKRVSDKVTITYITRLGYLDDQGIRVSYKLTKHFSLEGETHQNGESGVDVKYRVQFK